MSEVLDRALVSEQFYAPSPSQRWAMRQIQIWSGHGDKHDPREKDPDKAISGHGGGRADVDYNPA